MALWRPLVVNSVKSLLELKKKDLENSRHKQHLEFCELFSSVDQFQWRGLLIDYIFAVYENVLPIITLNTIWTRIFFNFIAKMSGSYQRFFSSRSIIKMLIFWCIKEKEKRKEKDWLEQQQMAASVHLMNLLVQRECHKCCDFKHLSNFFFTYFQSKTIFYTFKFK